MQYNHNDWDWSDSWLGHRRERTDTFLFWWGYGGTLRLLVGVVGLEGRKKAV